MALRNAFPKQLKAIKKKDKIEKNNELSKFTEIKKINSKNPFIKNNLKRDINTTLEFKNNMQKKISLINENKKNYSYCESKNILDKGENQVLETNIDFKKDRINNTQNSNNINTLIENMNKFIFSLEVEREKRNKMYEEERRKTIKMFEEEKNETKNLVNFLLSELAKERIESSKKHNELVELFKENIKAQTALNEKIDKLIGSPPKKKK